MISPTILRLARPAILAWICRMLRSVEVASATISLTTCCGVGGLPRCLPRASAAVCQLVAINFAKILYQLLLARPLASVV